MRLIPTTITHKTSDPNDPTGGQTIDALIARQRALSQNQPTAPAQIASPWQGAAFMANSFVNSLQQKQAQDQETAGRTKLAQLMSGIDPTAGATPEQMAGITSLDTDLGTKLWADRLAQARGDANYKRERTDTIADREDTQAFELEKAGLATKAKAGEQSFSQEQDLRKEYQTLPLIKAFPVVQTGLERMNSGAADNSPVGDIALIYGFMKLQDPESVVREGEYATAQNAAGVPDRVANLYNQVIKGVRLTPEQRTEFLRVGGQQYKNLAAQVGETNTRYQTIAKQHGIDPTRVLMTPKSYDEPAPGEPDAGAPAAPGAPPAPGAPQELGQAPNAQGDLVVPSAAIDELRAHPEQAAQFDAAFKQPGLAAKYLAMPR